MKFENDFGFPLEDCANNEEACVEVLSKYLNSGYLGLMLGAGVSFSLDLPDWKKLVLAISEKVQPGKVENADYGVDELKTITQDVKDILNNQNAYFTIVKELLYEKVDFNFNLVKKELLIAISTLFIGNKRGNISNVITYNFDSVFEWYFDTLGLDVNTITKEQLLLRNSDVNITHIHGYLPHDVRYGKDSDFLIFSKDEFSDRLLSGNDYWKDHFYEFFRRHIFMTVGMSAGSLNDDVFPYLRQMDNWYETQKTYRRMPYGVAILTNNQSNIDLMPKCIKHGIIPLIVERDLIPSTIFKIVQKALIK